MNKYKILDWIIQRKAYIENRIRPLGYWPANFDRFDKNEWIYSFTRKTIIVNKCTKIKSALLICLSSMEAIYLIVLVNWPFRETLFFVLIPASRYVTCLICFFVFFWMCRVDSRQLFFGFHIEIQTKQMETGKKNPF